jgi:hypothetical protein
MSQRREPGDYLFGMAFRRKSYSAPGKTWDHDHCAFCWAKFADFEGDEILHEGYASVENAKWRADYHWICPSCFDEFEEKMQLTVVE